MAILFILLLIAVLLLTASRFRKPDSNPNLTIIELPITRNTGSGLVWYFLFILLVALLVAALNGA